jgi:quinol monooxygenase YgiN
MRPKSFLELYQDKNNKKAFSYLQLWETEADLENYRNSELFTMFGHSPRNYSTTNQKRGAWIN